MYIRETPPRKGNAVLYVKYEKDVERIKEILEEMDELNDLPDEFIKIYNKDEKYWLKSVYTCRYYTLNLTHLFYILFRENINYFYVEACQQLTEYDDQDAWTRRHEWEFMKLIEDFDSKNINKEE